MPPIASVSPSLTTTCVMAVRLLMLGMGPAAELMSSPLELFSTLTIILTRVMSPASRMTVGVTSSLSRASLNWTCVPAELTVAYGISLPSEIVALAFSSVTTSGFASDVVLLSASSASRTRLTLNFPPTIPKAMAAGLRPANEPLEIRLVVADENRVRRLVGLDRDALGEHLGYGHGRGRARRRWRSGSVERRERRRGDQRRAARGARRGRAARGEAEDALEGVHDVLWVCVGQANRLFLQRTARHLLRDGQLRHAGGPRHLRGLRDLGVRLELRLPGDDAADVVLLDRPEAAHVEERWKGSLPRHVASRK